MVRLLRVFEYRIRILKNMALSKYSQMGNSARNPISDPGCPCSSALQETPQLSLLSARPPESLQASRKIIRGHKMLTFYWEASPCGLRLCIWILFSSSTIYFLKIISSLGFLWQGASSNVCGEIRVLGRLRDLSKDASGKKVRNIPIVYGRSLLPQ